MIKFKTSDWHKYPEEQPDEGDIIFQTHPTGIRIWLNRGIRIYINKWQNPYDKVSPFYWLSIKLPLLPDDALKDHELT